MRKYCWLLTLWNCFFILRINTKYQIHIHTSAFITIASNTFCSILSILDEQKVEVERISYLLKLIIISLISYEVPIKNMSDSQAIVKSTSGDNMLSISVYTVCISLSGSVDFICCVQYQTLAPCAPLPVSSDSEDKAA